MWRGSQLPRASARAVADRFAGWQAGVGREAALREQIVEAGRRMHALGFAAGSDGNLSARLDEERVLVTPSGLSKGFLHPEQLLVVDLAGTLQPSFHPMRRGLRPSSELFMHLEAYRQRADTHAVIHAHPPMAIACTVAALSLAGCVLPEVMYHLGSIPTAPYATPGTNEGAASVRELVRHHDALLLDRHGSLTLGDSPLTALMRLEWVEQAARIMLAAHSATGGRCPACRRSRWRGFRRSAKATLRQPGARQAPARRPARMRGASDNGGGRGKSTKQTKSPRRVRGLLCTPYGTRTRVFTLKG